MPFLVIPRKQWPSFCHDFNLRHQRELADIEWMDGDKKNPRAIAHNLVFKGVVAELDDPAQEDKMYIIAGEPPENRLTHIIRSPRQVVLQFDERGEPVGVKIDDGQGTTTLLSLLRVRAAREGSLWEETLRHLRRG